MQKIVLDNQVTILTSRSGLLPVVALQVWVDFGSADEPAEWAGTAHVIEHMLFKGAEGRPGQELAKKVESWGGNINAWTSFDETVYHLVLPARQFRKAARLLAQTVLHPAFDQTELDREKLVILEEIHQGKDQPTHLCSERLFATVFKKHPYGRPIIGFEHTVRNVDSKVLRTIHNKHYRGGNLTVVAVGDIQEQRAAEILASVFSEARKGRRRGEREQEPLQRRPRTSLQNAPVEEETFMIGFPVPGFAHEDMATLSMISALLSEGESSLLNLALRRRQALCSDVYAYAYTPRDAGLFVVGGSVPRNNVKPALDQTGQVLAELAEHPMPVEELDKVRRMVRADVLFRSETVQGEARTLGYYQTMTGDPNYEEQYLARLDSISPMDVMAAARTYLVPERTSLTLVHPEGARSAGKRLIKDLAASVTLRLRSSKSKTKPMTRKPSGVYKKALPNGLTILILPRKGPAVAAVRAIWLGGLLAESASRNGLSSLTAELLTRGTENRPGDAVVRQMEALGGSLSASSGRNTISIQAEFPSKHWDEATDIFLDSLLHSSFEDGEFDLAKQALLADLTARRDNPAAQAFDLFRKTLFGARHPYGRPLPGSIETVQTLTAAMARRFHKTLLQPNHMVLAAAGDLDPDGFVEQVERRMGLKAGKGTSKPPANPSFPKRPRASRAVMKRQQAHIVLGYPGLKVGDRDRFALRVLMDVMGGQSGRLFVQLRDRRGLAYHVGFYSLRGLAPGYVAAYMATDPNRVTEALEGLRQELNAVRKNPPTNREIREAKTHIIGSHLIGRQTGSAMVSSLAIDELYGLGHDAFLRYPDRIQDVTRDDVAACAARLLDPSREVCTVVAPFHEDEKQEP